MQWLIHPNEVYSFPGSTGSGQKRDIDLLLYRKHVEEVYIVTCLTQGLQKMPIYANIVSKTSKRGDRSQTTQKTWIHPHAVSKAPRRGRKSHMQCVKHQRKRESIALPRETRRGRQSIMLYSNHPEQDNTYHVVHSSSIFRYIITSDLVWLSGIGTGETMLSSK